MRKVGIIFVGLNCLRYLFMLYFVVTMKEERKVLVVVFPLWILAYLFTQRANDDDKEEGEEKINTNPFPLFRVKMRLNTK